MFKLLKPYLVSIVFVIKVVDIDKRIWLLHFHVLFAH